MCFLFSNMFSISDLFNYVVYVWGDGGREGAERGERSAEGRRAWGDGVEALTVGRGVTSRLW